MRVAILTLMLFVAAPIYASRVLQSEVSADGKYRVEVADYTHITQFELWSTDISTGARRKIGHTVSFDYDVDNFLISSDSHTVVYRYGRTAIGVWLLYSTPIYSFSNSGHQICQPMTLGGMVDRNMTKWWNGNFVRYRADPLIDEDYHWYVVPMTGGTVFQEIFLDGFENGTTGGWR